MAFNAINRNPRILVKNLTVYRGDDVILLLEANINGVAVDLTYSKLTMDVRDHRNNEVLLHLSSEDETILKTPGGIVRLGENNHPEYVDLEQNQILLVFNHRLTDNLTFDSGLYDLQASDDSVYTLMRGIFYLKHDQTKVY